MSSLDKNGRFIVQAIYAPENRARLEAAFADEIALALKDGFTEEELKAAKTGWLQSREVSRAQDAELAAKAEHAAVPGPDDCLGRRARSESRRADPRSRQSGARTASRSGEDLDRQGRRLCEGCKMIRLPLAMSVVPLLRSLVSQGAPRQRRRASSSERSSRRKGRCCATSPDRSPNPWILRFGTGQPEARIYMALFEGLTEYDPKTTQPIPAIAERWDVNADSSEFVFHLRPTARWSNGDPITAHDFVYSFRRGLDPAFAVANAYMAYYILYAQGYNEGGVFVRDPATGAFVLQKDVSGDSELRLVLPGSRSGAAEAIAANPSCARRWPGRSSCRSAPKTSASKRSTTTRCASR